MDDLQVISIAQQDYTNQSGDCTRNDREKSPAVLTDMPAS